MSLARAEKLLTALTEPEVRQLDHDIAASRRESLRTLYAILKDGREKGDPIDREETFALLFDRPYSKREDYLLRNELRLFTTRVYDFLARAQHESELRRNESLRDVMLLKSLLHRGMFREFETMLKKCRARAVERIDYDNARRLNDLRFQFLILHKEISPEVMLEAHRTMQENLSYLKKIYRADVSINQHNRVVCEQNLDGMNRSIGSTHVEIDLDMSMSDTPYALYYENASLAYQSAGEKRIEYARRALENISIVAEIDDFYRTHRLLSLAMLASAYFVERHYVEARHYFEESLAYARSRGIRPRLDVVFNYASTLMRLREFQLVLDLLDEYGEEIARQPKVRFKCECLRCFCHIFLGRPDEAFEAIPSNISQRSESEHHYFRFIYLILPYLRDDSESALRETRNFIDYFNRHKDSLQYPAEKEIVLLFRRFYTLLLDVPDRQEQRQALAELSERIEAIIDAPEYRDYLYLAWLRDQVNDVVRSIG